MDGARGGQRGAWCSRPRRPGTRLVATRSLISSASPSTPMRRAPSGHNTTSEAPQRGMYAGVCPRIWSPAFPFGGWSCVEPCALLRRPDDEEDVMARCQYRSAKVDDVVYTLGDDDYVMVTDLLCISCSLHFLIAK